MSGYFGLLRACFIINDKAEVAVIGFFVSSLTSCKWQGGAIWLSHTR